MFGKNKSKRPRAIVAVDFEHWYIALERQYGIKPDIKAWNEELRNEYDIIDMAFFGDFSNYGLRGELDKIRNVTGMVINTQNKSEHYEKDFTDFIMLDYIYQKAMTNSNADIFIIFTGDGHFSSVVRFIINDCRKKVGIYGVKNALSYQLKEYASWYREVPANEKAVNAYYKMIANYMSYLMVHREEATEKSIIEKVSEKNDVKKKAVAFALSQMIKDGYIMKSPAPKGGKSKKDPSLKANWELLQKDKIWAQP
ncbi:MAG: NYN domain-containing protein [Clostridia bacterium]|nr:NYN domain-containing protein [Clostridia bacterium]